MSNRGWPALDFDSAVRGKAALDALEQLRIAIHDYTPAQMAERFFKRSSSAVVACVLPCGGWGDSRCDPSTTDVVYHLAGSA